MNAPEPMHPAESPTPDARDVRAVVVGAMLAMFLVAIDQTIVAPALPPIAHDLGDFELISWIVTAYLLTSACVTPIVGKLSDLHGRRPVLVGCLVIFMASSAVCALAPDMPSLIVARGLQGIGGGGLIPVCQTVIGDVVAPRERGRYAGYFSAVWASSAVLGPTVGGLLAQHAGWPWIFWINLPLGCVALAMVDRALRRLPVERRPMSIDYASSALLSAATIALLLVLSLGGKRLAWTAPETLALTVAAVVLGVLFVRQQTRSAEPILPARLLGERRVIQPVLIASFLFYGCYLAITVLTPIYYQVGRATTISEAGLLMIPVMLTSSLTSNTAGRYSQRTGFYKRPLMIGLPISIAALLPLALLANWLPPWGSAVLLMVVGWGIGPCFPCSTVAVQNAVERRDLGTVSGALAFARVLGAAIIVAAASALVLGLIAQALPDAGATTSLEDLTRRELPAVARDAVAHAFGVTYGVLALGLVASFAVFATVEDRRLREQVGPSGAPTTDRSS